MAALSTTPSIPSPSSFEPIRYSEDELSAIREVRTLLLSKGIAESRIGLCTLAVATINTKLRVEETAKKYMKWLEALETFQIEGLGGNDGALWNPAVAPMLRSYAPCGKDKDGRSIFWIRGGSIQPEEEKASILCGAMYFLAIHGDNRSLHEGITFVIDVARQPAKKVGNEAKLQKVWQSFPLRPQRIFIAGASMVKRVFINGLLKVAWFFTKQKILDRILFADMAEVLAEVPLESAPSYVGGGGGRGGGAGDGGAHDGAALASSPEDPKEKPSGGGVGEGGLLSLTTGDPELDRETRELAAWVKQRLEQFPIPEL